MTNPKTRKTGTAPGRRTATADAVVANGIQVRAARSTAQVERRGEEEEQCIVPAAWMQRVEDTEYDSEYEAGSLITPTTTDAAEGYEEEEQFVEAEEAEEEEEEDEVKSDSSFSLEECINEFHARRIRRVSTQSREVAHHMEECARTAAKVVAVGEIYMDPADVDLIKQNRSNKEHERKCKPCKNGFCYCFTSDSGDGGGCAAARGTHVRQPRRSRKSESNQVSYMLPQRHFVPTQEKTRQSAPASLKCPQKLQKQTQTQKEQQQKQPQQIHVKKIINTNNTHVSPELLTAISRLETTSADAPLIHIIQELHDNCVISEVRVNKHKMHAQQRSHSLNAKSSPKKAHFHCDTQTRNGSPDQYVCTPPIKQPSPSAPALEQISKFESTPPTVRDVDGGFMYSSPLNTSSKSNDSPRRKHKSAGRLLQKRLSHTNHIQFKPRNLNVPPPKPPRSSLSWEEKSSLSTLASTSPSVREAERIVDNFLRSKGVEVPGGQTQQQVFRSVKKNCKFETELANKELAKLEKNKSNLLTRQDEKVRNSKPLPSCPSLSDIERVVNSKKQDNYEKNTRKHVVPEKPVKELSIGWKEPKITEMLNYDTNGNRKEFKSQGVQAEPQCSIGWQIPPKVDLDTVDGGVRHNLASNMEQKHTPIKTRLFSAYKTKGRESQKFVITEQLRNFSPWNNKSRLYTTTTRQPKSNLKSSSSTRLFLNNSKKKILRLVSPKKYNKERRNFEVRKTPLRTVGVQTSHEDLRAYENSSTPQSPPGSYHSAVQILQQSSSTPSSNSQPTPNFDFTRTVLSPPKKAPRATQRRLNFPLNRAGSTAVHDVDTDLKGALKAATMTKTYRSFHSDLDQDVTLSKMGYILGNIRAKLEASDEHAIRTFQEIERRELQSAGFDCTDGTPTCQEARLKLHSDLSPRRPHPLLEPHEPIYSEIEEDSIHISGSPQFDNKTGIQHFSAERNPEALYAKVQKAPKVHLADSTPTPLGKFLHESLKNTRITPIKPLPPEPLSSDVSYHSPQTHNTSSHVSEILPHCHSLNNIRVMEHNSPPKKHRNLSKSDLSLQRSEVFLENLCRNELRMESSELERMEKVENKKSNQSCASLPNAALWRANTSICSSLPEDSVSYELPNDVDDATVEGVECISYAAGSQMGLHAIAPPKSHNQSTPKKQTFLTKYFLDEQRQQPLNVQISSNAEEFAHASHMLHNQSSSCPNTPRKLPPLPAEVDQESPHAVSLNEVYAGMHNETIFNNNSKNSNGPGSTNQLYTSTWSRYKRLKDALRKSLRKSKNYVRNETKRLSTSLSFPSTHSATTTPQNSDRTIHNQISNGHAYSSASSFNLDTLFALHDEHAPLQEQLVKAVSICRQLPDLEISPEMVEAERLLLFSTLRREASKQKLALVAIRGLKQPETQSLRRYFIDDMHLPVKANASQDLFFNYFYICTFECGGVIRSTQSVECHNFEAIFRDCGIEFAGSSKQLQSEVGGETEEMTVKCQVFMLRLRKVSTLSLEPRKPVLKLPSVLTPSPTSSSSTSSEEIVSRFRLHGTFTLHASDFTPYEYVECASKNSDQVCLRSSRSCNIPLTRHNKSTNLTKEIVLTGRAEARFPKQYYNGYLNVQDPHSLHNWNRRWCMLEGLQLLVWQDEQQLGEKPLLCLHLLNSVQTAPLSQSPRELCARPRAFCLQCNITKDGEEVATAAVFFSAETQHELNTWLQHLNVVLDFVAKWMQ